MKIVGTGIIVRDGKILIAQRPEGKSLAGFWEFPGGKLEDGETIEQCLIRELAEELSVEATVGEFIMNTSHDYDHGSFSLEVFFVHITDNTEPHNNVHQQLKWVTPQEMELYTFPVADIAIIEKLKTIDLKSMQH